MANVSVIGIDLAKTVFQLHGAGRGGTAALRKTLRRGQVMEFMARLPKCTIGMEASSGAHYWAREFEKMGHVVRLIAPQFVKPYVKSNKNDAADAEAICEALTRPNMRFVSIKPVAHQDIQCVHRIRERLVGNRTGLVNEIRGLLAEYGVVLPMGIGHIRRQLPRILEDAEVGLTDPSRELFADLLDEFGHLEERIATYDTRLRRIFRTNQDLCGRLTKVPGVGPITATAMLAVSSQVHGFKNGRQFSAFLGLVPRQNSSGGKTVLGGISKRGDRYLRCLLIHGARAALSRAEGKTDRLSRWAIKKRESRGTNKACVALANKNARILWALMKTGEEYRRAA